MAENQCSEVLWVAVSALFGPFSFFSTKQYVFYFFCHASTLSHLMATLKVMSNDTIVPLPMKQAHTY